VPFGCAGSCVCGLGQRRQQVTAGRSKDWNLIATVEACYGLLLYCKVLVIKTARQRQQDIIASAPEQTSSVCLNLQLWPVGCVLLLLLCCCCCAVAVLLLCCRVSVIRTARQAARLSLVPGSDPSTGPCSSTHHTVQDPAAAAAPPAAAAAVTKTILSC
jgi:hypothetical protein